MDIFEQIMGVEEAAGIWGLSPDHVKRLCRDGAVKAKKIGNAWVIDKNQPNPKKRNYRRKKNYRK